MRILATSRMSRAKRYGWLAMVAILWPLHTFSAPVAPTDLGATTVSSSRIELTWSDVADDEYGFIVDRSLDGIEWMAVATTGADVTRFLDRGLDLDTIYWYRVRAYNLDGVSDDSNIAGATTADLATPLQLRAFTRKVSEIRLNWTPNVSNADSYRVERLEPPYTDWTEIAVLDAPVKQYKDQSVVEGTTYYYRVIALNGTGESDPSNFASATAIVFNVVPEGPTNLVAFAISSTRCRLTWEDISDSESGFLIFRALSPSGPWERIASTGRDVTRYVDRHFSAGTTYYYQLKAYANPGAISTGSEIVSSLAASVGSPAELWAVAATDSQVNLSWIDTADNEAGFRVKRRAGAGGDWAVIAEVGADVTSYSDTTVEPGVTYYYKVRAYGPEGRSDNSNNSSATPGGLPPVP